MVHNAPRRSYDNIDSSPESPYLRINRFTSIYRQDLDLLVYTDVADLLGNLWTASFSCRLKYKAQKAF